MALPGSGRGNTESCIQAGNYLIGGESSRGSENVREFQSMSSVSFSAAKFIGDALEFLG